jgi:hypothetical protein
VLEFRSQATPVASAIGEVATAADDSSPFLGLDGGDWIALASVVVTLLIFYANWRFQTKVQTNQVNWQRAMETQRQEEREEDIARAEAATTPCIETEVFNSHHYIRILLPLGNYQIGERIDECDGITIQAKNKGQVKVRLGEPTLKLTDGRTLVVTPLDIDLQDTVTQFPVVLEPGHSINVHADAEDMVEMLAKAGFSGEVELIGVYRDGIDNQYRSAPFAFDLEKDWSPRTIHNDGVEDGSDPSIEDV